MSELAEEQRLELDPPDVLERNSPEERMQIYEALRNERQISWRPALMERRRRVFDAAKSKTWEDAKTKLQVRTYRIVIEEGLEQLRLHPNVEDLDYPLIIVVTPTATLNLLATREFKLTSKGLPEDLISMKVLPGISGLLETEKVPYGELDRLYNSLNNWV